MTDPSATPTAPASWVSVSVPTTPMATVTATPTTTTTTAVTAARVGAVPPLRSGAVVVVAGLIAVWWLLAVTLLEHGGVVPTPWEVGRALWDDRELMGRSARSTASIATQGWLIGNGLAIGLAVLVVGVPVVERVVLRIGAAACCLPILAVGPILTTALDGSTPRKALAGIAVFFTTLVGTLRGLRAADRAMLDVVRASGGGAVARARFVRLHAALPGMFAALRIAAPAAVLGAIVGEFLGSDRGPGSPGIGSPGIGGVGIGGAMVQAEQALEAPRTWALAVVASAVAAFGYALTALPARLFLPWAPPPQPGRQPRPGRPPTSLATTGTVVLSVAMIGGLWYALVELLDPGRTVTRDPRGVWEYLFAAPAAAANREALLTGLGRTLGDAALGCAVGTLAALGLAVACALLRPVERALLPVATMLRPVPLVVVTPLLVLVVGRGPLTGSVTAGLVVFLPTLMTLAVGLRSAPGAAADLVLARGGGPVTVLRRVALPGALPALVAAARVAVPGALVGVLVAEWLATGDGLGHFMRHAQRGFDYGGLWSAVVAIVVVSMVIYAVIGFMEAIVLARYGPAPSRHD